MSKEMKAIVGGNVLDANASGYIKNGVVLIDGKKIIAVGKREQVPVPEATETISAEGGYVVPGLIDAHNHLYLDPGPFKAQSLDPDPVLLRRMIRNARRQLRDGVTTLRESGTPRFVDLQIKQLIEEGLVLGPHLVCSGQWITPSDGHGAFPGACSIADGPDEVRKAVRVILSHGVDFVKVFITGGTASHGVSPVIAYMGPDELKAAVDEAHSRGKLVSAHIHGGPGVRFAVDAGVDMLDHGAYITDDAEIDLIASRGVAWAFNQGARMNEPSPLLPQFEKEKILASRKSSIVALNKALKAGIKVMAGPDGYHDDHACVWNLEALVRCGATPREALLASTRTPAEVLGLGRERGALESDKFADLLIVGGDPLQNISALRDLRLVMKEGMVYKDL